MAQCRWLSRIIFAAFVLGACDNAKAASPLETSLLEFVDQHCLDCHDSATSKGNFDMEKLSLDLRDPDEMRQWTRIFDMATSREMPPKEKYKPSEKALADFSSGLSAGLTYYGGKFHTRIPERRLNNLEIQHAVKDVLDVDVAIGSFLPPDLKVRGLSNQAEGLSPTGEFLLNYGRYVDKVVAYALAPTPTTASNYNTTTDSQRLASDFELQKSSLVRGGSAFLYSSGKHVLNFKAKHDGKYRFRCEAVPANLNEDIDVLIKGAGGKLGRGNSLQSYRRRAVRGQLSSRSQPKHFVLKKAGGKQQIEFMLDLTIGEKVSVFTESALSEVTSKTVGKLDSFDKLPGFYVQNITIEGPLHGDTPFQTEAGGKAPAISIEQAETYLRGVLPPLFRQTAKEEIASYMKDVLVANGAGSGLALALKKALMSPGFLYSLDQKGNEKAIAMRLSLLLWRSLPDAELVEAAEAGRLRNREERMRQARRMLADPRASRFRVDFLDQWLWLDRFYSKEFPTRVVSEFFHQPEFLLYSMLAQVHRMSERILVENRSLLELVDSDWSYLNDRLARLYQLDLPAKPGNALALVKLPAGSARGGILNQGALMRITSVADETSPVVRGVWMAENILNIKIPEPPNNIPDFIPDTRAAKSLKEQFLLHRKNPSCASCHVKIDPVGFSFENYDAIGAFRTHYGQSTASKNSKKRPADVPRAAEVDTGDFKFRSVPMRGVGDVKAYILDHPEDTFVSAFLSKLVEFSLGREVQFSDRVQIESIIHNGRKNNYAMRDLILNFIGSDLFVGPGVTN